MELNQAVIPEAADTRAADIPEGDTPTTATVMTEAQINQGAESGCPGSLPGR